MKYTVEVLIDLPRQEVVQKLDNTDNLKHWQRGLTGAEHLSGVPGEVGARMKLSYLFGKRKMDLIETITKRDLPKELHATYDTKGMHNIQVNQFEETAEGQTKWICQSEFSAKSFLLRLMMVLMPGAFRKQTQKYMTDFKEFVEQGTSVTALK